MRRQNLTLLAKWWWKLETREGLWQQIVKVKYLWNKTITTVKTNLSDSSCWKEIMKVRDVYIAGRGIKIKDGSLVRFWKDPWLDKTPLMQLYPQLFDICQLPDISFKEVREKEFIIPFRRRLFTVWEE